MSETPKYDALRDQALADPLRYSELEVWAVLKDTERDLAAARAEVEALRLRYYTLAHTVWLALDDGEERETAAGVVTVVAPEHYERLCQLVPLDHEDLSSEFADIALAREQEEQR